MWSTNGQYPNPEPAQIIVTFWAMVALKRPVKNVKEKQRFKGNNQYLKSRREFKARLDGIYKLLQLRRNCIQFFNRQFSRREERRLLLGKIEDLEY